MTYPHPDPDPYDDAMTDEPQFAHGQVFVSARYVVLVKGQGRVAYDATLHAGQRKSTEIKLELTPVDPTRRLVSRETLNWAQEFRGVIRPSVEALAAQIAQLKGLDSTAATFNALRELSELWCAIEFVPRPGNKPGETWTTLKLITIYPDQAACDVAYRAYRRSLVDGPAGEPDPAVASTPFPSGQGDGPPPEDAAADPARANMAAFLPMLWVQAKAASPDDPAAKMAELIAGNPMVSKYFSIDSPEVQQLITVG